MDRTSADAHPVAMTYYRHALDDVAPALVEAGFRLHSTVRREPELLHETTPQGFLMAHRLGVA